MGAAPGFNPLVPWDDVFRQAALDKSYWDRRVRDPALVFMARGGAKKQAPTGAATDYTAGAGQARSPAKRARRAASARGKIAELQEELKNLKADAGGGTGATGTSAGRKGGKAGGKHESLSLNPYRACPRIYGEMARIRRVGDSYNDE